MLVGVGVARHPRVGAGVHLSVVVVGWVIGQVPDRCLVGNIERKLAPATA
jgi:hypothetical protein